MIKKKDTIAWPCIGKILLEDFLKPMSLSQYRLANDAGLSHSCVTGLVKGDRRITVEIAMRLSRYFGNSVEFWLRGQMEDDIRNAPKAIVKTIEKEVAPLDQSAA